MEVGQGGGEEVVERWVRLVEGGVLAAGLEVCFSGDGDL